MKFWGFHLREHVTNVLGCGVTFTCGWMPVFRINILSPSSEVKDETIFISYMLISTYKFTLLHNPEKYRHEKNYHKERWQTWYYRRVDYPLTFLMVLLWFLQIPLFLKTVISNTDIWNGIAWLTQPLLQNWISVQASERKAATRQTRKHEKKNLGSKSSRYWNSTRARTKTNLKNVSRVLAVQKKLLTPSMMKVTVSMPVLVYRNLPLGVNIRNNVITITEIIQVIIIINTENKFLFYSSQIQIYILKTTHNRTPRFYVPNAKASCCNNSEAVSLHPLSVTNLLTSHITVLSSQLIFCLPSRRFPKHFLTNIVYPFLLSPFEQKIQPKVNPFPWLQVITHIF